MTSILARTAIIYILLTFSLRIMGKRQLGELDVSELVSTLLVSEIASIPIDDPDIPLLNAILSILFIISVEIILSTIKNKSEKLKSVIEGKPEYIIYKGRLLQKALRSNRISINELLAEMRSQGIGDISCIYYAIVEQNGSLSILTRDKKDIAHPIIIDGEQIKDKIQELGYDDIWIESQIKRRNLNKDEIFLMTVNDDGDVNIIKRE